MGGEFLPADSTVVTRLNENAPSRATVILEPAVGPSTVHSHLSELLRILPIADLGSDLISD
jgi:hypothetical protein